MKIEKIESFVLRIELTMDEARALERVTGGSSSPELAGKRCTPAETEAFKKMWGPISSLIGES